MEHNEFEKSTGIKPPKRIGCSAFLLSYSVFFLIGMALRYNNTGISIGIILITSFILSSISACIFEKIQEKSPSFKKEMGMYNKAYNDYKADRLQLKQNTIAKYSIPENEVNNPTIVKYLKSKPIIEKIMENQELMVWVNDNKLYMIHNDLLNCQGEIILPLENIRTFLRQGDMYVETNVSGGGGGGTSIPGAIVGNVVAGPVGAVIGSRKKNEPITSENKVVDTRQTILEFEHNSILHYMFFNSNAYNIFLDLIPEKEMAFIKNKNNNDLNKYEEIHQLSKLKDEGLITDDEFNLKKKQILGL